MFFWLSVEISPKTTKQQQQQWNQPSDDPNIHQVHLGLPADTETNKLEIIGRHIALFVPVGRFGFCSVTSAFALVTTALAKMESLQSVNFSSAALFSLLCPRAIIYHCFFGLQALESSGVCLLVFLVPVKKSQGQPERGGGGRLETKDCGCS